MYLQSWQPLTFLLFVLISYHEVTAGEPVAGTKLVESTIDVDGVAVLV